MLFSHGIFQERSDLHALSLNFWASKSHIFVLLCHVTSCREGVLCIGKNHEKPGSLGFSRLVKDYSFSQIFLTSPIFLAWWFDMSLVAMWNLVVISTFHINLGFIFSPSSEAKTRKTPNSRSATQRTTAIDCVGCFRRCLQLAKGTGTSVPWWEESGTPLFNSVNSFL